MLVKTSSCSLHKHASCKGHQIDTAAQKALYWQAVNNLTMHLTRRVSKREKKSPLAARGTGKAFKGHAVFFCA